MKKKYRIFSTIPPLIIMCVIFYFSHQEAAASSRLSGGIIENIFSLNEKIFSLELPIEERNHWLELLETLIRKAAHMTEYGILAIALSYSFYVYGKRGRSLILWSEVIAVLYAATDEFHQLFVPGRSGQVTDVLIDGSGALIGCILFYFISKKFRKVSN
ncbi:VanZ family protein [Anaerocolumna sp.]|uniref:VanZ family protein n=1 Tax=Anaerocolumna sp. TaxID=2041569 RepID=UPI0028A9590A|nr:VanZ family protein [Anaerocolumna sp.]